ncbi:peptidoglycan-binding protein [Candidatus Kaiserbacteria bacterium]|nr:peptidoglycan-binding protein [Candidatus Kaiserbacteria bacterium]
MNRARNASIVAFFVLVLMVGSAQPTSALTVAEMEAQIQSLLSRIVSLSGGASVQTDGSVVASPVAQHRVCTVLYRNLSQGARGDDVLVLQEFLRAQGYFYANATGYFGPLTAQAVARWQASQGIAAVGAVGPLTRERIRLWCGGGGGGGGGVIPTDPSADPRCRAWYDGCNDCSRDYPGGPAMCTLRACIWQASAYCKEYFDSSTNRPPVISSFSGPTMLNINQTGTWTIQASDPESGPLSYSLRWGDEYLVAPMAGYAAEAFVQTTTFTHAYSAAGTYTVTVIVRDSAGKEAKTSTTVAVGVSKDPYSSCPQYMPAECIGGTYVSQGVGVDGCPLAPKCVLNNVCTADAMQCPDGSYVGRTGPSCEFVCPSIY